MRLLDWLHRRRDRQMSAASKAALADPAVRAKMSAASKAAWAQRKTRRSAVPVCRTCGRSELECLCDPEAFEEDATASA